MLDGMRILAWGSRSAVELSASLLGHAGAQVHVADHDSLPSFSGYDVVIVSSDTASFATRAKISSLKTSGNLIVCDISAMGPQSARLGGRWTDGQIQAITGLMDTTGFESGEPVNIGIPFTEISAALYAAAAVAAASRVLRTQGFAQNIDVSLFACASSALTTFLPKAFARSSVERVGNRHPACAPWNAYRTLDGWVLICTSTEDQWRKLKIAINQPALDDNRFATLNERVRNVDSLDPFIEAWSSGLTTDQCSALCEEIGVAAGPIVPISLLHEEPNFKLRHPAAAAQILAGEIGKHTYTAVTPFRTFPLMNDGECHRNEAGTARRLTAKSIGYVAGFEARQGPSPTGALAGVRVIEIGQYTTAPLVGKHLAALGAEVIKVEPLEGEVARNWSPGQDGLSYFFALNNTDKKSISLDLKQASHLRYLEALLATSDVLVENLRPGALAKLGLGRSSLKEINPALIYCSISGFGIESAYPTRPAFDTVIQAMSGLMDLTRNGDGSPVKAGASAADILGGQAALFAIVAELVEPSEGSGRFIEISMQDVAAWSCLFAAGNPVSKGVAIACSDGYVSAEAKNSVEIDVVRSQTPGAQCEAMTRELLIAKLESLGIASVPVVRMDELMDDADFLADILSVGRGNDGAFWPLIKMPYRLSRTPAKVRTVPGRPEPVMVQTTEKHESTNEISITNTQES
ncbi:CaiB/BaiF CoA-transferase family protein [Paraburkholderia sediminicola]|uniref:CaiB/BaiF CoA-transferase family protein n=1 Tax=Paraburkholderia sediminicola TaxID=458836 RepID=UPI0038B8EDCD